MVPESMLASQEQGRKIVVVLAAAAEGRAALETRVVRLSGDAVAGVSKTAEVLEALERQPAYLLLVDDDSLGEACEPLLREVRGSWPDLSIDVLASHPTRDRVLAALAAGANDLLDVSSDDGLRLSIDKARARHERSEGLPPPPRLGRELMLGDSQLMQRVARLIEQVAPSEATVLLRGESGTGKELVARALHELGPLAKRPFVKIDCASLPDQLLESELFGYERGAFTGAASRKLGRVELAQGGTLFLDEIGELHLATQAKLLRLLQDREIERLGGTKTLRVNVRVIAATHRDLESMVDQRQFRQDLFYRLNVIRVELPPLRDRSEDIPLLADHFLQKHAALEGRRLTFAPDAMRWLVQQRFPGNVRELENMVERAVALAAGNAVTVDDLSMRPGTAVEPAGAAGILPEGGLDLDSHLGDIEKSLLLQALERAGGVRTNAARILHTSFRSFRYRLAKYGLDEGNADEDSSEPTSGSDAG